MIIVNYVYTYTYTYTYLADAFIQSDLQLRKTVIYHKMATNTRSAI